MGQADAMTAAREYHLREQRRILWAWQHGRCANPKCEQLHRCSDDMEVAHRIADTKPNRKKYGVNTVDHLFNKGLVCRGLRGGVSCNDALNVGNKPGTAEALARRIRRELAGGVLVEV